MAQERLTGTVKWFNGTKGFGFITPDQPGDDLFVHQSSVKSDGYRSLGEGESVEFSISEGSDGRTKAVEVTGPGGDPVRGEAGGGDRRDGGYGGGRGGGGRGYGGGSYGFNDGGSRGGGGGGYRGGGGACYNCGESGHMARDCDSGGGGGGGRVGCYNCGEQGHIARECPSMQ